MRSFFVRDPQPASADLAHLPEIGALVNQGKGQRSGHASATVLKGEIKMKNPLVGFSLFVVTLTANLAWAEVAEVNPRRAPGGMAIEFKNHRLEPCASPTPLPRAVELSAGQRRVSDLLP